MGILEAKKLLRTIGYTPTNSEILDRQTQRSIKAFQRDLKIHPSGVVDKETEVKLRECFNNFKK